MKRRQITGFRLQVIGIITAIILIAQSVALADVVLVPDFRVDQDPTPNQLVDVDSSITYGYFVVLYDYGGVPAECRARRFDFNGNALANSFQVKSGCTGTSVAIDSNGNMAFAYNCFPGGVQHICMRRFDINENALDAGKQIDQSADIAALGTIDSLLAGGLVVGYLQRDGEDWNLYGRIYDSFGNPIGDEFRVDQNPNVDYNCGYSARPIVAANSTGRIYLAWSDSRNYCDSSSPDSVYARIFDSAGNPLSNEFRVSLDALGYVIGATSIATTSNGNFIIAWHEQMPLYIVSDVFARAYDSSGAPLADEFKVNQVASNASNGDIACAPSGRCLILYTGNMGRHLNSNGVLLDAEFVISPASTVVAAAIAGNNSFVSVRSGYIVDAPIMANIMGPNDAIPTTSGALLIILAALFMGLIIFASKRKILSEGVRA